MLLLCADCHVNMPRWRYYTIHYRLMRRRDLLHIWGCFSRELWEWEVCTMTVGGKEMPWIWKQNTICQRVSDAIKSNEKVSKGKQWELVCLAHTGCLPGRRHREHSQIPREEHQMQQCRLHGIPDQGVICNMALLLGYLHSDTSGRKTRPDTRLGIAPGCGHVILCAFSS